MRGRWREGKGEVREMGRGEMDRKNEREGVGEVRDSKREIVKKKGRGVRERERCER